MDTRIGDLIAAADGGDRPSAQTLFRVLYADLHRKARRELARQGSGVTLGPTTLLHEVYLQICRRDGSDFPDRARFMAYAARVMRGLIVDYVRTRQAQKRGGRFEITHITSDVAVATHESARLQELSDALDALMDVDPALAEIVDLKFFCGFSMPEIAAMRGVSERTVQRQWEKARLYLLRALGNDAALPGTIAQAETT
jgi:RNA polymerase sigma factor (TIGR02999 family)